MVMLAAENQLHQLTNFTKFFTKYQLWHINQVTTIILKPMVMLAAENQLHQPKNFTKNFVEN